MFFQAIHGATTVCSNTREEILLKTRELLDEMLKRNKLSADDIVSIIFTATRDLDAVYPAVAAREMGITNASLFCCQEMFVKGSLESCIRILMHIQTPEKIKPHHVYLEKAVTLRPDLIQKDQGEPSKNPRLSIAIDGPAGAGKSTVAKILSQRLGILYLDTGSMYRAVGLHMLLNGIDPKNPDDVNRLLPDTHVDIEYKDGVQIVYLNGKDVTSEIRTPEVSQAASDVGVIPEVRLKLVELQRKIAGKTSVVMDGRDIGTYVLPNADRKFFLTASVEERAKRRWLEMKNKGYQKSLDDIIDEIKKRDENDSNRSFAPLKKADDAILIDTTNKTIEEVVSEIIRYLPMSREE